MNHVDLSDQEFAALAQLLHDTAGLSFDESRRDSLGFSIAERMNATGTTDVPAYLRRLVGPDGATERQALLDEVTIPETHFFRNPPQVRALRKYVLPELLRQAATGKRLRIWSAGCSTGEEAYTIAILIRELMPSSANWDIKIIATDVSNRALAIAAKGHYGERSFVMTDPLDLSRWFVLDALAGSWVVRNEVRELVDFSHHNLVTEAPPLDGETFDLILCRNVTIYFDRETTRRLMKRLHNRLRDGGYLFLGHAETLWQITQDFTLVPLGDAFVYRRLDHADGPEKHRRAVLPDRRTEDELRPTRANRRASDRERRDRGELEGSGSAATGVQLAAASATGATQVATAAQRRDPLDAVRRAITEGRYTEAADVAAEVAATTPLRADAHYLQGVALTDLGNDAAALVVLRKAVYLDPEHGFAHFLLAGALERLGEPAAAARSYRAAASTLGNRQMDAVASELGGRSVAELGALCMELALRAEQIDRLSGGPS